MPVALLAALVLATLSAVFAMQNSDVVTVELFVWSWNASLALVLILTLGAGVVVGYLAGLPRTLTRSGEVRRLRKRITELESRLPPPPPESVPAAANLTGEAGTGERADYD
jgi:uncharacterized integral membrane protein